MAEKESKWSRFLFVGLMGAFGLFFQFKPIWLSHFAQVPSDAVDPRLNNLILENFHQWWTGKIAASQFFNVPFYFPAKDVGTWTDTLWGAAPLYSFFRALGSPMETAYSLWMIALSFLNYLAAFLALRFQLRLKMIGSVLGAFLFAFGAPRFAQIGHAQLFPAFITPFFFAWLYQAFLPFPLLNRKKFGLMLAALVYQIYCGFYLGWFLCLSLSLLFLFLLALPRTRLDFLKLLRKNFQFFIWSGFLAGLALLPQLVPFLRAARIFGARPYSGLRATFPRIISFFHVGQENVFEGWLTGVLHANELPISHEHKMGVGILTSLAIGLGFYWGRKAKSVLLMRTGVVCLLLIAISISFFHVSLWGLLYLAFPGGKAIRVASRIILALLFIYSVGLAYFTDQLRGPLKLLIGTFIILEQLTAIPNTSTEFLHARVSKLTESIPSPCQVFYLLDLHSPLSKDEFQMDAMMSAFSTGRKTLNGYYGHDPLLWDLSPGNQEKLSQWEQLNNFKLTRSCVVSI